MQTFYLIRSISCRSGRIDFDLLFRGFAGLRVDDPVWNHSTFSKNRNRLLEGDVAAEFFATLLDRPDARRRLSNARFSVDGTMIQAWASMKSFGPSDGSGEPPRRRQGRSPQLPRQPTQQCDPCLDHCSRRTAAKLTCASGPAERSAALAMVDRLPIVSPMTLGADRGFDAKRLAVRLRERQVTPYIAQNVSRRRSAIDGQTTRHTDYLLSLRARKRIEDASGLIKTTAGQARIKLRGVGRVAWLFTALRRRSQSDPPAQADRCRMTPWLTHPPLPRPHSPGKASPHPDQLDRQQVQDDLRCRQMRPPRVETAIS